MRLRLVPEGCGARKGRGPAAGISHRTDAKTESADSASQPLASGPAAQTEARASKSVGYSNYSQDTLPTACRRITPKWTTSSRAVSYLRAVEFAIGGQADSAMPNWSESCGSVLAHSTESFDDGRSGHCPQACRRGGALACSGLKRKIISEVAPNLARDRSTSSRSLRNRT
jgi:hypothetical protein